MHKVFLGIGGNIGNKRSNFDKVYTLIEHELGKIVGHSSVYETPPWGFAADENFWNQVLVVETGRSPEYLLDKIHEIEDRLGRERKAGGYFPRPMDIDILYFDEVCVETEVLVIPHPHIRRRKFVLVPLTEIAPELRHPQFGLTSAQMLESCPDNSPIKKVQI